MWMCTECLNPSIKVTLLLSYPKYIIIDWKFRWKTIVQLNKMNEQWIRKKIGVQSILSWYFCSVKIEYAYREPSNQYYNENSTPTQHNTTQFDTFDIIQCNLFHSISFHWCVLFVCLCFFFLNFATIQHLNPWQMQKIWANLLKKAFGHYND